MKKSMVVHCARCDFGDALLEDTKWKEAAGKLRELGWSELKKEGWICPRCARSRKLELKVREKGFRGKFRKDGKMYVKTANGIFRVGEVATQ